MQGTIPSFANCSDLRAIWLDRNELAGELPGDLPPGLEELNLSLNNLVGTIPATLGNVTSLEIFFCVFNGLDGGIPGEFAALRELEILAVGGNRLSGGFPEAIMNMSALARLDLNTNRFSGEMPAGIGNSLPNLQRFFVGGNFYHGDLPSSLANASNLVKFDIASNFFTGVVPASIGNLAHLTWLNLEMNQLHARSKQDWEFMDGLANCTKLQRLSLAANQLQGHVPNSLGNFTVQLQSLYLGQNHLSGSFPSGVANLPNLIVLGLDYNMFTGSVPQWLGHQKRLQVLSLSNNNFTGYIPPSLSNLSNLIEIYLDSNQFIGNIPSSFGNFQFLRTVTTSVNNFHGSLPMEIFRIPTIEQVESAFNNLSGELPTEVGNAKQLMILHLSSNKLSGDISNILGNCENLQEVVLDQNNFGGGIPTSFGKLISLKLLNLSHNRLSGLIPVSLGDLELLEQLDLAFNNLTGQVPTNGIFKNSTAIEIDGNLGLCGGAPELHLPECPIKTSNKKNKHKVSVLVKVVVPLASMVTLAIVILLLFIWKGRNKGKSIYLPSSGREFPKVSYNDLARATNRFSMANLIGKGRYSFVYRGQLFEHINVVAIKVFCLETRGAQKSFIAECNALRNVRHRNLVPILTACSSIDSSGNDFKALVYEFMPRGDLHKLLYSTPHDGSSDLCYISLGQRLSIAVDVSDALAYLHHSHQRAIIHCDLKPSNILLDDNMTAHVGDFGLARLRIGPASFSNSDSTTSFAVNGTIGYVAPGMCGQIYTVFSY